MKILFLAPQPFYQERGTPIAVRLALEVLSKRPRTSITLLTYHEGEQIEIPGVSIKRIKVPGIKNIGPGISLKKLVCDLCFAFNTVQVLWRNRAEQFQIIHAVEESVFIALIIKFLTGIPFIYDMDSSLSLQLCEKWSWSRFLMPAFRWIESLAIKNSLAVVPVCFALFEIAERSGSTTTQVLHDISLLDFKSSDRTNYTNIRSELSLPTDSKIALYIGNLEKYQGIDLLLSAFAYTLDALTPDSHVVIIGGQQEHIQTYSEQATQLGLVGRVHFLGPRPVSALKALLLQADLLLSPRVLGNNTPMKIYSYLHSGVPIVATDLPTHTQVLNDSVAFLAEADKENFGKALRQAFCDQAARQRIGQAAEALARQKYTFDIFQRDLNNLYDLIKANPAIAQCKALPT